MDIETEERLKQLKNLKDLIDKLNRLKDQTNKAWNNALGLGDLFHIKNIEKLKRKVESEIIEIESQS